MNDKQRKAMWASKGNHDNTLVDEVVLVSENDGDFYRQRLNPISNMFEKKMNNGIFRKQNALYSKSFVDSVGKDAVERYRKEHGLGHVSIEDRRKIGHELLKQSMQSARENVHYNKITTTGKGQAMMARDKLKRVEEDERIRKGMRFH
jgi:hypothetical protein